MSSKELWQRARQTYASFVDDLLESSIELQRVWQERRAELQDAEKAHDLMGDLYALVFAVELKARGVREFDEDLLDVGDDEARLEEVLEGWMPLSRAATLSGLSASTLRNQVPSGRLKARKVGRNWLTKPSWVFEYLGSRRYNAKAPPRPERIMEVSSAPR